MQVSIQAQAVLLLTAQFTKSDNRGAKPLSPNEWAKLALWLKDHNLQPESLINDDPRRLLSGWIDRTVTWDRIELLLGRAGALGLALEKWQRAGLWVLTRPDPDYPERLKKRLKLASAPVLFGCGNKRLLNGGGIAVVGSRDAAEEDLAFASQLGADAAAQGLSIVSGGARGVDQNAMLGALDREGTAIGVLADSLLRAATSAKYRKHLMSHDLVLVSPFNPEAGFNVGNAMARNRYIYCLSDVAVVVRTDREKGGTWNGAIEDLKAQWVPLLAKPSPAPSSGNAELVRRGAKWLPDDRADLAALFGGDGREAEAQAAPESLPLSVPELREAASTEGWMDQEQPAEVKEATALASLDQVTSYDLFLDRMAALTAEAALSLEDLSKQLDVSKTQLRAWLKDAAAEKRIEKLIRPVRYRIANAAPKQASMFGDD